LPFPPSLLSTCVSIGIRGIPTPEVRRAMPRHALGGLSDLPSKSCSARCRDELCQWGVTAGRRAAQPKACPAAARNLLVHIRRPCPGLDLLRLVLCGRLPSSQIILAGFNSFFSSNGSVSDSVTNIPANPHFQVSWRVNTPRCKAETLDSTYYVCYYW